MRRSEETSFWQLLLAAELPFAKSQRIIPKLAACASEAEAIRALHDHPLVTPGERQRMERARQDLTGAIEAGARILPLSELPSRTAEALPGLPGVWAIGDAKIVERPIVGIVGTRGATTYGKAVAIKFAETLGRAGVTIVSGGAFGIDAAAHRGALDSGGATIAVMPTGVDVAYPASHRDLFRDIRKHGLQVSQFCLGMQPRQDTFLARNLLIAALSDAVLIVEAPEASGAMHTANRAADFGRPVYVVPSSISQPTFKGSHALIRSGATLVDHPDQILEDLAICASPMSKLETYGSEAQRKLLEALSSEPISSEAAAEMAMLDPSEALSELTLLELEGRVIRSPGGFVLAP